MIQESDIGYLFVFKLNANLNVLFCLDPSIKFVNETLQSVTENSNSNTNEEGDVEMNEEIATNYRSSPNPRTSNSAWVTFDPFSNATVFLVGRFRFEEFAGDQLSWFQSEDSVMNVDWLNYLKQINKVLRKYKNELLVDFPYGLDSKQRRSFAGVFESKFPLLADRYAQFRQMAQTQDETKKINTAIANSKLSTFNHADFSVSLLCYFVHLLH